MDARRWTATATALALVAIAAFFALGRARVAEPPAVSAPAPTALGPASGSPAARRVAASAASVAVEQPASPPAVDTGEGATGRFERVSRALELMRFPPDSRPLGPQMRDVLAPNARHEHALPLALAAARRPGEGAGTKNDVSFLFTGNVYAVAPGEPLVATLSAFHGDGTSPHDRVTLRPDSCALSVFAQPAYKPAASLALNDEGRDGDALAGDRVYSVSVDPARVDALSSHNGLARLDVTFAVDGATDEAHASLDFRVTSAPPARFVGVVGESLGDEGLTLNVAVRVARPGRYVVQGLLFDAADKPVGYAVARPTLGAGEATVPLLYFGLLFREANAAGPYSFRTLTGYRLPDDGEPERTDMPAWPGPYTTRAYRPQDFSDKEYDSPSKALKAKALNDLAAKSPPRPPPTDE